MRVTKSNFTIIGANIKECNPLPFFRDRNHQKTLIDAGLLPEERDGFAYETGFRILPYTMQDSYTRAEHEITLKTVVLENDCLRATFLQGYGGRLYSLFDKKRDRELLYVNPVFQPANLAIRNAWFSGGIEWNVGHFGHFFLTCEPVFFARCRDKDGAEFLRMYEYERCKGFFLQIDFHLPQGAEQLCAHVSIQNSHPQAMPIYWWTNIAVPEERDARVFSGSDQVIYIRPESLRREDGVHGFGHGTMPFLETIEGMDASYPDNLPYSCEYFFQNPANAAHTWESVAYNDGTVFWERSTPRLRYRKMFCWGNRRGGGHWQEFLTKKGTGKYLEIQGGMSPTQVHGQDIGAGERWSFTQVFGGANIDTARAFGDWKEAQTYLYGVMDAGLSQADLLAADSRFDALYGQMPEEILCSGSGWGALEALRDPSMIPQGMIFAPETMGEEQEPWRILLESGTMPPMQALPVSWMTDIRWLAILEASLKNPKNRSASALLHYGVMLYENDRWDEGILALKQSMELQPSAVCAKCLSQAMLQSGNGEQACAYIQRAVELGGLKISSAFAEEYIKTHTAAGRFCEAWQFYKQLPEHLRNEERIMIEVATAAFETSEWDFLEMLFSHEYTLVREGESTIIELWFKKQALDEAKRRGIADYRELLDELQDTLEPPYHIDFRLVPPKKAKVKATVE